MIIHFDLHFSDKCIPLQRVLPFTKLSLFFSSVNRIAPFCFRRLPLKSAVLPSLSPLSGCMLSQKTLEWQCIIRRGGNPCCLHPYIILSSCLFQRFCIIAFQFAIVSCFALRQVFFIMPASVYSISLFCFMLLFSAGAAPYG